MWLEKKRMLENIKNMGPELRQGDINSLVEALGKELPAEYESFLMKYNGGAPVECELDFDGKKLGISGDTLGYFFGLGRNSDILAKLENLSYFLPKDMFPIADSPAGNLFLMSVNEKSYGNVYYKDHETEDSFEFDDSKEELPESMVLVANSFNEFLEKLYDPDE